MNEILANSIATVTNEEGELTTIDRSPLRFENIPCSSHTLNLIATADFQKVLNDSAPFNFKEQFNKTFEKLKKLWNLHNRSPKAAEAFFRELGALLIIYFIRIIYI